MVCGGRLKMSDFWLNHEDTRLFVKSQWPVHRYVYLVWRHFLALYLVAWLVADLAIVGNLATSYVFLTDWTFTVMTLYAVLSCICSTCLAAGRGDRPIPCNSPSNKLHPTVSDNDNASESNEQTPLLPEPHQPHHATKLPHLLKLVWLLFNICVAINPMVTVIYWSFLTPSSESPIHWALNIHLHVLNMVFIYLDLLVSAVPVRPVHFIYGLLYLLVYAVFTFIYYLAGGVNPITKGTAIYPNILNWSNSGRTLLIACAVVVVQPFSHVVAYALYRLRVYIHRRCFETLHLDIDRTE